MKESLFAILLTLFEKTLTQLKENHLSTNKEAEIEKQVEDDSESIVGIKGMNIEFIKSADQKSMRVFTYDEQMKLTKASYQFLMRMLTWGIVTPEAMEAILNQLVLSDSRIVTLEETKWAIRNTLIDSLNAKQLAFLDLVLYQKEDGFILH